MAQWLRIRLPMQGTQVRALVWEDPTCRGETRPVSHNYCRQILNHCATGEALSVLSSRSTLGLSNLILLEKKIYIMRLLLDLILFFH